MSFDSWLKLMQSWGLEPNKETFELLIKCYSEKHRYYHNQSHIKAVLRHLNDSNSLTNHPNEVELALWFHDAIYKPFSSSNELDSAKWASEFLEENGISKMVKDRVFNLIMVTLHTGIPNDNDEKLMVDIDLSILGCPGDVYQQFESNIRKEYKLVPAFIYKKKRKEILESFLRREMIFSHLHFQEKFEEQARRNIENAIQNL